MENQGQKRWLFFFLSFVISAPFLQHSLGIIESGALGGGVNTAQDVAFSIDKWWAGDYQQKKNNYLNDNTGFRPDLIRLNNEIDYRLYRKFHARDVVEGRDGYLFEKGYIDDYTGVFFEEDSTLKKQMVKLKMVQDTLEKLGKTFVFVEAASKASYYPDKFPLQKRYSVFTGHSNYKSHIAACDSLHINHIDMNAWFVRIKEEQAENKLFSKNGTHWTDYGSLLVADSLVKYIGKTRNIKLPQLKMHRLAYSDSARHTDADIAEGTNLIWPFKKETLCYPEFSYEQDSGTTKPKIIMIGDSFIWPLYSNHFLEGVSDEWEFWYYFQEVWRANKKCDKIDHYVMAGYDWKKALANTDCIIAVYSTINLNSFQYPGSMVFELYAHYFPEKK